jgi:hypothetical protein
MIRHLRSLLLVPLMAGCYAYRPAVGGNPVPGERVRFVLTDSGTANMAAQLGPSTEALAGLVIDQPPGNYLVSVLSTRRRNGVETDWAGEQVTLPRPLVATVEQRHFSRSRTVFASAAIVLGLAIVREAFWGTGGTFGGSPPGGGPGPR